MRLLHLVSEPGPSGRGVPQKVVRTVEVWRKLGVEADFVDLATGRLGFDGIADSERRAQAPTRRSGWIREMERRGRVLLEVLERSSPDIIYSRELVWSPAIERIARQHRLVLEINSDRRRELLASSRLAAAFWRATSPRIRRRAAGIVAVTDELLFLTRPDGVPGIVIPNGTVVPPGPPPDVEAGARPMLLMIVGRAATWHGLDRFSLLAEAMPEFEFVVCGDLAGLSSVVGPAVRRESPRIGADLEDLLRRATVAVGSLALVRNRMSEACPLKSRTCLAAGLPLVYGYRDPALSGDEPFALRLGEDDWRSGPPTGAIRRFIQSVRDEPSRRGEARRFAREHLDQELLERRRIGFFRSLLDGDRAVASTGG